MSADSVKRIVQAVLETEEPIDFGEYDPADYKDIMGEPPMKHGYFVYFSEPVEFARIGFVTKIGPYPNTHEANRKLRFGLMDLAGVTGRVVREPLTPRQVEEM